MLGKRIKKLLFYNIQFSLIYDRKEIFICVETIKFVIVECHEMMKIVLDVQYH